MSLSVVILTKNEEKNILDCLESVKSADEIVIVDDESEDRTCEVAQRFSKKIKIFKRKLNGDFSAQRNFGLNKTRGSWVLFVDADERVSGEFFDQIKSQVEDTNAVGFKIKRKDVIFGKKINFGETGKFSLIRIAQKGSGFWKGKVHEEWRIEGPVETLTGELLHFPHQTVGEFLSELNNYSSIRARELYDRGVKTSPLEIIAYPNLKFIMNFLIRLGFLDGIPGFIIAMTMSFHSFLVRSKLWLKSS